MSKLLIGALFSIIGNGLFAVRNYYGKKVQLLLSFIANFLWLFEYIFVFPSATYTLVMSFTVVYLITYQFKDKLLKRFKVDVVFVLMIIMFIIAAIIGIITYEGPLSICGTLIIFFDLFAVYMFTAQGLRYKNIVAAVLYGIIDFSIGNYFAAGLDVINVIVPIVTIFKHRGEEILDREGFSENIELVKFTYEIRELRKKRK